MVRAEALGSVYARFLKLMGVQGWSAGTLNATTPWDGIQSGTRLDH